MSPYSRSRRFTDIILRSGITVMKTAIDRTMKQVYKKVIKRINRIVKIAWCSARRRCKGSNGVLQVRRLQKRPEEDLK